MVGKKQKPEYCIVDPRHFTGPPALFSTNRPLCTLALFLQIIPGFSPLECPKNKGYSPYGKELILTLFYSNLKPRKK
jgi:hypothetical protein